MTIYHRYNSLMAQAVRGQGANRALDKKREKEKGQITSSSPLSVSQNRSGARVFNGVEGDLLDRLVAFGGIGVFNALRATNRQLRESAAELISSRPLTRKGVRYIHSLKIGTAKCAYLLIHSLVDARQAFKRALKEGSDNLSPQERAQIGEVFEVVELFDQRVVLKREFTPESLVSLMDQVLNIGIQEEDPDARVQVLNQVKGLIEAYQTPVAGLEQLKEKYAEFYYLSYASQLFRPSIREEIKDCFKGEKNERLQGLPMAFATKGQRKLANTTKRSKQGAALFRRLYSSGWFNSDLSGVDIGDLFSSGACPTNKDKLKEAVPFIKMNTFLKKIAVRYFVHYLFNAFGIKSEMKKRQKVNLLLWQRSKSVGSKYQQLDREINQGISRQLVPLMARWSTGVDAVVSFIKNEWSDEMLHFFKGAPLPLPLPLDDQSLEYAVNMINLLKSVAGLKVDDLKLAVKNLQVFLDGIPAEDQKEYVDDLLKEVVSILEMMRSPMGQYIESCLYDFMRSLIGRLDYFYPTDRWFKKYALSFVSFAEMGEFDALDKLITVIPEKQQKISLAQPLLAEIFEQISRSQQGRLEQGLPVGVKALEHLFSKIKEENITLKEDVMKMAKRLARVAQAPQLEAAIDERLESAS